MSKATILRAVWYQGLTISCFSKAFLTVFLLLVVFSACGGIHTSSKLPVLTAYFPMLAYMTSRERMDYSCHHH